MTCLLLACGPPSAPESKSEPPRVVDRAEPLGTVNGEPIDADIFERMLALKLQGPSKHRRGTLQEIKRRVLATLVDRMLVNQAVAKAGIDVTDAVVAEDQRSRRTSAQPHIPDELLHRWDIRFALQLDALLDASGIDVPVSDAEVRRAYEKNRHLLVEKAGVHTRHILVRLSEDATTAQVTEAHKKIARIRAALKAGRDFADVARKHSEGPYASKGGDLGFATVGQLDPSYEKAAFALSVGQVSGVVRSRFGLHLIQLVERREERHRSLASMRDQIAASLRYKKRPESFSKLLGELNKQATIVIKAEFWTE